ncbi:MAG: sigma-70 family RNA polymerase sigma factor [Bacteroidota bacterium]|nr:sigma-70 family RNA polymerase sigma factor [Ferruginibacter sp.]
MESVIALEPAKWVKNYADALYKFTIVRINDVGVAEDIVQETFLSAWRARDTYKGQASEKNWLYAICKNKIIDHYRAQNTRKENVGVREENSYFDQSDHWTPETAPQNWHMDYSHPVETKEFYAVLEGCKQKLKNVQQTVFVMKYFDDVDSEDICKTLGLTPANFWVLIHRAKLHLRSCLEKRWINNY